MIKLNALLKMLRAFVKGEFELELVPNYLREHVLPDGGALLLVGAAALAVPEAATLFWLGVAAAMAKYATKIRKIMENKGLVGSPD